MPHPSRKVERTCPICGTRFQVPLSRIKYGRGRHCSPGCQYETRRRMRKEKKLKCKSCGKEFSRRDGYLRRKKNGGKYCSPRCAYDNKKRGSESANWKGGRTALEEGPNALRKTPEYKTWRTSVFNRDNFTCRHCHLKARELRAHHILEYSKYPLHRLDLDNGITLCRECHDAVHARPCG